MHASYSTAFVGRENYTFHVKLSTGTPGKTQGPRDWTQRSPGAGFTADSASRGNQVDLRAGTLAPSNAPGRLSPDALRCRSSATGR